MVLGMLVHDKVTRLCLYHYVGQGTITITNKVLFS